MNKIGNYSGPSVEVLLPQTVPGSSQLPLKDSGVGVSGHLADNRST